MTYHSGEGLEGNVRAVLPQVERVVIVDNASGKATRRRLETLAAAHPGRIELVLNPANRGLGAAQNQGIARALERGARWVLLLDDDSTVDPAMVSALLETWAGCPGRQRVGIVTPRIVDRLSGREYRCCVPWSVGFRRIEIGDRACVDGLFQAFASGSLVRREVFEEIGLMREDFFIESIDWDFCLRAQTRGWRIVAAGAARLTHQLGRQTTHRLLGLRVATTHHSAGRRYLAMRNRAILIREYGLRVRGMLAFALVTSWKEWLMIALFEDDRLAKLWAVARGVVAGACVPRRRLAAIPSLAGRADAR